MIKNLSVSFPTSTISYSENKFFAQSIHRNCIVRIYNILNVRTFMSGGDGGKTFKKEK